MELSQAVKIANHIVDLLAPSCDIINIAGSCRRQKPEVKDLEIVALAKSEIIVDLFGEEIGRTRNKQFIENTKIIGEHLKGSTIDGKYCQIKVSSKLKQYLINLDLFMPDHFDYYRQYVIRTGSADYSAKVIAVGWRKIGWCGSDVGLRKMSDCTETKNSENKSVWKCVNPNAELPPHWKSEEEFFDWINVKWIEPSLRIVN